MDKGCRNAHPFPGFFSKIFLRKNLPFTYLELQSQMTPCFTEKNEKIFFGCGCFILLASKKPFTYSHWEQPNAHPKSQKIFYPFTYLELRSRNAPCFYKKFEKYFFRLRVLILLAQKVPSLIPTGRGHLGIVIPKKGKKICPPDMAGVFVFAWRRQHGLFIINR